MKTMKNGSAKRVKSNNKKSKKKHSIWVVLSKLFLYLAVLIEMAIGCDRLQILRSIN